MPKKPTVLLIGATGQLGKLIANHLQSQESITLRVTSRKKSQLPELSQEYTEAVYLDLDNPQTFTEALQGVHRLFLLTSYSFSMVVQSKTLIDAAKKAGVEHLVHLGVFSPAWDCTAPHFAWHQMIEVYIQHSGFKWTFLHPNCFLQNLTGFSLIKNGTFRWYAQNKPCGWIALEDVAEAAAKILIDGPSIHQSKDYWFSTEVLTLQEVTQLLTEVTGKSFIADPQPAEQFLKDQGADIKTLDPYFYSVAESFKQIENGQMPYLSIVKDDMQILVGRKGTTVRQWIEMHKAELLQLAQKQTGSHIAWGAI